MILCFADGNHRPIPGLKHIVEAVLAHGICCGNMKRFDLKTQKAGNDLPSLCVQTKFREAACMSIPGNESKAADCP